MRLDGWKSIGAHFGRERSTVIRWASERGMPVHRIPGTGRGSVYALTEELDAWLEADRLAEGGESSVPPESDPQAETAPPAETSTTTRRLSGVAMAGIAALLAIGSLSAYALTRETEPREAAQLPADAELADLYLEARSNWAARNPESLADSIEKLQRVIAEEPGFAPAYTALADSYVLAREFGSLDDVDAFARARAAADSALRIDPDNPDAMRTAGFIEYWWRGNGEDSARLFRSAIAASPQSAQSRFWFGNVLIDNGDFAAGMAELERARLLEPASIPLQADIAWARWSQGDEDRALASLEALRDRDPQLATTRDYLSVIYLTRGDISGFVAESEALGQIRGLASDQAQAARMRSVLEDDPARVPAMLLAELEAALAQGERTSLPWPVFVASAAGDRAAVLRLLEIGNSRGEHWGSAGLIRKVRERWRNDRAIIALLDELRPPSLVQE